jgi:hypothetical protein
MRVRGAPPNQFRARIRYAFDNALARGVGVVALWLGLISVGVVIAAGIAIRLFHISVNGRTNGGLIEGVWASLERTLDPGTGGNDIGWGFRTVSLLVTLAGIFVVTTLIGLTANGIDRKLDQLRRGRSLVVEQGHTLVLGWSPKLATVLNELVGANDNQPRARIVILADVDKQLMDESVRRWVPRCGTTRIVCRTGRPYEPRDLALVAPAKAKAVVVLADDDDPYDACCVKTVLALLQAGIPASAPLVVEVRNPHRARSLSRATNDRVISVVSSDVLARITAQVCRQSGLSTVYQELLDFAGDEIYFGSDERLAGLTFGDALMSYDTSSVIGVRRADGCIRLVPPMDLVLGPGDSVIAVSRDDDTVCFTDRPPGPRLAPAAAPPRRPAPEKVLVLGWNPMGPALLRELDAYASAGAMARVLYDPDEVTRPKSVPGIRSLDVEWVKGNTTDEVLLAKQLADRDWDHVVVLCYHGLPVAESDARTLLTLLEIQHVLGARPENEIPPTIVAELLDVEDVRIAPATAADDFIVSDRLTSYVLAQLSENAELAGVFDELLGAGGAELAIYDVTTVAEPGPARYGELVEAAACYGDIAIGYRSGGRGARGVVSLNLPKSDLIDLSVGDELIVLTAGVR